MSDAVAESILGVAVVTAALAELAFVLGYIRVPWWRTPEGRMMMAKDAVLLLVLTLAVIGIFAPDLPFRTELRVGAWSLIAVVFTWKAALFHRRQAEARRRRRQAEAPHITVRTD